MIPLSQIRTLGYDLARPECVLTTSNGRIYCSSWRGGVTVLEPDGSFLLSHLGAETGAY